MEIRRKIEGNAGGKYCGYEKAGNNELLLHNKGKSNVRKRK